MVVTCAPVQSLYSGVFFFVHTFLRSFIRLDSIHFGFVVDLSVNMPQMNLFIIITVQPKPYKYLFLYMLLHRWLFEVDVSLLYCSMLAATTTRHLMIIIRFNTLIFIFSLVFRLFISFPFSPVSQISYDGLWSQLNYCLLFSC